MKKTLVVYYSKTGTTAAAARVIMAATNGEGFELKPVTPFPDDMYETSDVAAAQYQAHQLPELVSVPDITEYDQILIGTPTWSSRMATPVAAFVSQTVFADKEVRFFATSVGQTTGLIDDFTAQLLSGDQKQPLILTKRPTEAEIHDWLN
ncbi:flavodoxin [Secundilactobacillus kimchicus]|uniref:flavodoxin n=1 Tax=Secundilactobacillus kimchicus TaxID=528209 RepID=UPI001C01F0AE|nr:flavodoxin [Secundilactobacillus kimchicus]